MRMNEMMIFNNPEFGSVRTVCIDGEPWLVGKDVALILGYAKPNNALASHVDEDDSLKWGVIDSMGRKQETIIIIFCAILLRPSVLTRKSKLGARALLGNQ